MKQTFGLIVLIFAGWLAFALVAPKSEAAPARTFSSSKDCRECHSQIYDEWQQSHHAISWTNPAPRLLSNDFAKEDCIDCHAPRPIFVTGIGERVLPRPTRRNEGVDCISCHQLPTQDDGTPGGMAGSVTNANVACKPEVRRDLQRVELCSACHNQHKTIDQWKASSFSKGINKQDCSSCHMPLVASIGEGSGQHRSHRFPGGDVLDLVKTAVTLEGGPEDGNWVVTLTNVGAGHSFPTDERSRAGDIFWRELDMEGAQWKHVHRMRSPYRDEVDVLDTLLLADEARRIPIFSEPEEIGEAIAADKPIEVALFYKRTPWWLDPDNPDPENESQLVTKVELRP